MKILRKNDSGPEVGELQHALEGLGFLPDDVTSLARADGDGVYGEQTEKAINRLRIGFGWEEHGQATRNTLRAIRAQVSALQRKLAALGCYAGETHGTFDTATRDALKQFQEKHPELKATGQLDDATRRLLAESPPYTFDEVLCSELDAVNRGREEAALPAEQRATGSGNAVVRAHQARLLGLALSGGGIRSATFNLGVLQALSRLRLLRCVDYLSTVSGGGYIGSWLHAWVQREPRGIHGVEDALAVEAGAKSHEPRQVTWLRRYSNYLTPRVGLLSPDTMAGVATWLRNVILNQAILGALGILVLCMPWLLLLLLDAMSGTGWPQGIAVIGIGLVAIAALVGGMETGASARIHWAGTAVIGMAACGALLLGIAAPLAVLHSGIPSWQGPLALGVAQGLFVAIGWHFGLRRARQSGEDDPAESRLNTWTLLAALAGAVLVVALTAWILLFLVSGKSPQARMILVVLGPAGVLTTLLLGIAAQIGLAGRGLREPSREWWSRAGGILISLMLGWLAITGVALLGRYGAYYAGAWITALGGIVWLATTLAGVVLGRSPATDGKDGWKETVATVAPWVFIAGLLVLLSCALHIGLIKAGGRGDIPVCTPVPDASTPGLRPAYRISLDLPEGKGTATGEVMRVKPDPGCSLATYADETSRALANAPYFLAELLGASFLLAILLGWRVDINVFAFHMFYRNRLERCYMGASNPKRRDDPFTDLDTTDAPKLADLMQRPYPLINAALNISRSNNLAWQERKAASFLFTPEFCGYQLPGGAAADLAAYQKTGQYMNQCQAGWIGLGMPVTISGAAASPNAGYHTNPATAFLMTVFNVRLGWWIQNTRYSETWAKPGPNQSIFYLLKELLASTTDTDDFVYVSDGGHFENLGIYELVRRRCRYVIACDSGCDPDYTFEDLGNAIRKCQIDLGIEIEIDPRAIVPDRETGHSQFHCAVGTIHYERLDPVAAPGYLLYIKASLTGDEPSDVNQYKAGHAAFPHESTGDQWYSESQFESYRKLGEHVAMEVLSQPKEDATPQRAVLPISENQQLPCDLERLFHALSERWYPPSGAVHASFSRHGEELEKIYDRMRQDTNLRFLDAQIYPEWLKMSAHVEIGTQPSLHSMFPSTQDELRAGFYLCNTLIQLMENVYLDLNLEEEHGHPDNRGWMNLFHHWAWAGMVRVTWAVCAATYGARFQQFCRRRLGLENGTLALGKPIKGSTQEWGDDINFVEQEHVRLILTQEDTRRADIGPLMVQPIEMRVSDPFGKEKDFAFPVGFALVSEPNRAGQRSLVYYRIQDHLRRMGLGRKGLRVLQAKYGDLRIDIPSDLNKIIPEADPALLHHLWYSTLSAGSKEADD